MPKQEVAKKGTQRDSHHDPSVVSHEDEHEHKGVKVLDGIERSFDNVTSLAGRFAVLPRHSL